MPLLISRLVEGTFTNITCNWHMSHFLICLNWFVSTCYKWAHLCPFNRFNMDIILILITSMCNIFLSIHRYSSKTRSLMRKAMCCLYAAMLCRSSFQSMAWKEPCSWSQRVLQIRRVFSSIMKRYVGAGCMQPLPSSPSHPLMPNHTHTPLRVFACFWGPSRPTEPVNADLNLRSNLILIQITILMWYKTYFTVHSVSGKKMYFFSGTQSNFPLIMLNLPPFNYVFLYFIGKNSLQMCQNFPGTRFLSSLLFPGMVTARILVTDNIQWGAVCSSLTLWTVFEMSFSAFCKLWLSSTSRTVNKCLQLEVCFH